MHTATPPFELTKHGYYVPSGEANSFFSSVQNSDGTGVIQGLKIFKAGTFKDSMGYQRTWEIEHLEQMIFHYNLLKDRGIFPNVPVRDGHLGIFGSGGTVVGYLENPTRLDQFLTADLQITEPEAFAKWGRGTFRARSLEVGMYETNDEATYWPVMMGVAFVDIPAVEGLYTKFSNPSRRPGKSLHHFAQTMVDEKETPVGTNGGDNPEGTTPPATPPTPANPQTAPAEGGTTTPPVQPSQHSQGTPAPAPAPTPAPAPAPVAPSATFSFRIDGQHVNDFGRVQTHIDTLEGFRRETMDTARKDFIKALATGNKIAATQIESLTAHALSLSDTQWDAFRAAYDAAPQNPLFGQFSNDGTGTPPTSNPVADEVSILEERLKMHRKAGMPEDKIKETESYKRLQVLVAKS